MADEGQKNALGGGSSLFKAIVLDVILDPKINTPGGMASVWGTLVYISFTSAAQDRKRVCSPKEVLMSVIHLRRVGDMSLIFHRVK